MMARAVASDAPNDFDRDAVAVAAPPPQASLRLTRGVVNSRNTLGRGLDAVVAGPLGQPRRAYETMI
jgi:hypothetical protein